MKQERRSAQDTVEEAMLGHRARGHDRSGEDGN